MYKVINGLLCYVDRRGYVKAIGRTWGDDIYYYCVYLLNNNGKEW